MRAAIFLLCLSVAAPVAARDGFFIEGGAAAAFVETIDGTGVSISTTASINQAFDVGYAARIGAGWRFGAYALGLSVEAAQNAIGQSIAVFPGAPAATVEQSGTLDRLSLFATLDYDLFAFSAPRLGVDIRPFLSGGVGLQRTALNYEPAPNGSTLTFAPNIAPVTRAGAGVAIGLRSGWDIALRYDVTMAPGAAFEGSGDNVGTNLSFNQIQQNIGVTLRYSLGRIFGRDAIAERRRRRAPL